MYVRGAYTQRRADAIFWIGKHSEIDIVLAD